MKFQFQSDVHLEVGDQYDTYKINPTAPYLILAGDIGNLNQYEQYLSFLRRQCTLFEKVFWVLGNHEFYNISRTDGIELAEKMARDPECGGKLTLLHRTRYDLNVGLALCSTGGSTPDRNEYSRNHDASHNGDVYETITILGCTLNSNIQGTDDEKLMVRMRVSDFHKIQKWTVDDHNAEHERDLAWLKGEIASVMSDSHPIAATEELGRRQRLPRRKILVITHHAPFRAGSSKPEHETAQWHGAFATELLERDSVNAEHHASLPTPATAAEPRLSPSSPSSADNQASENQNILQNVHTWIFGHTHYTTECTRGGVRCIANQRGYVFPWDIKTDTSNTHTNDDNDNILEIDNNDDNDDDNDNNKKNPDPDALRHSKHNQKRKGILRRISSMLPPLPSSLQSTNSTPKQKTFVVRPPKPPTDHHLHHQGDGTLPFDPLRYFEI